MQDALSQYWWVLLIAIALVVAIGKGKKDNKTPAPNPNPKPVTPPVDNRTRLIIDTDMGAKSDPDDVQCYIAQASDILQRYNVLGLVATSIRGYDNVPFINGLLDDMSAVNAKYRKLPVYQGSLRPTSGNPSGDAAGARFMADQIKKSSADNRLEIHIWGQANTFALTLSMIKDSLDKLQFVDVYWVANWNRFTDEGSFEYMKQFKQHLTLYRDEEAFRGIMRSGDKSKLEKLHQNILKSPVGRVYAKHPIPEASYNWKAGDLSLYFFASNKSFRDNLFKADGGKFFVADGKASENAVAAKDFRDEMVRVVTQNVNRW